MKHQAQTPNTMMRYALPLALGVLVAIVVLIALSGPLDIFKNALHANDKGELDGFINTVDDEVKGPVNTAMAALVPIGLAGGGALMAAGSQKGMPIMISSGAAGALVLLGNGFIA
jgi:hypothetical protein